MSKSEKQGATTACKEWSGKWKKCSLRGEFKERERNTPRANESSFQKCDDPGFPFDRTYETEIEFKRITLPV